MSKTKAHQANRARLDDPIRAIEARTRGMVASSPLELLVIFTVALVLTFLTYAITVRAAYVGVYEAYRNVNVLEELLKQDSLVPADPETYDGADNDMKTIGFNQRVLFRSLQVMGPKSAEDDPNSIADTDDPYHKLYTLLIPDTTEGGVPPIPLVSSVGPDGERTRGLPTVEIIAHLAAGNAGMHEKDAPVYRQMTADIIASLLANQPGVRDDVRRLLESKFEGDEALKTGLRRVLKVLGSHLGLKRGITIWAEPAASDDDILRLLYDQVDAEGRNNALYHLKSPGENSNWDQLRALDEFAATLLSRMHASRSVKDARQWIPQFQGPEQFAMWLCLWWMLLLLGVRWLRRTIPSIEEGVLRVQVDTSLHEAFSGSSADGPSAVKAAQRSRTCREIAQSIAGSLEDRQQVSVRTWKVVQERLQVIKAQDTICAQAKALPSALVMLARAVRVTLAELVQIDRRGGGTARRLLGVCVRELEHNPSLPSPNALGRACQEVRAHDARARWIIMWLATALPAIGFIGTVRGISSALSSADSIVRARDTAAQAAAITDVAGMLGVAFTTTLMALLMGLFTSFLSRRQSMAEQAIIDGMQTAVEPLLDHSLIQSGNGGAS